MVRPNNPRATPQVTGSDLDATDQRGINDSVANRTPQQTLIGQQRPSPGNVFADYIGAHVQGGQAGIEAIQRMVDAGLRSTADSTGNTPRATDGSSGAMPQSRPSQERADGD